MRRAKHNLSHYRVTAGDFGYLYPFSATEILPGDTFRCSATALIRMQPLMTPLMHPVRLSIAHFFVPNRLVWSGWENFITGKTAGNIPTVVQSADSEITDYMGAAYGNFPVNALPVRSFNLIYNEFFRDQDIIPERTEDDQSIPKVAWQKDYFTTARTQPQMGDGAKININISGELKVKGIGMKDNIFSSNWPGAYESDGTQRDYASAWTGQINNDIVIEGTGDPGFPNIRTEAGTINAQMSIEEWRQQLAIQKYREARNKYGSRYKDYLAFLGVRSADARLDRPEYLGGGRQTIAFSEVLSTVEDTSNSVPLGTQGGHGIASIRTRPWRRMFTEHGHIISLMHVRPTNVYNNAVDRNWLRTDYQSYWQKENEMLGEQPVLNRELYAGAANSTDIFGYSPRHDDYRTQRSYATGPMRKNEYNTWHLARDFSAQPALNAEFIECSPSKRVLRSANDPAFYMMIQNRMTARRLVPKYARN